MKTWKKILAIFLAFMIFIFTTSICEIEAEASVGTTIITVAGAVVTAYELAKIHQEAYESYTSGSWNKVQDWAIRNFGPIGFIMTANPEAELIDRVVKPFLRKQGIISENDSDEEAFNKWSSYVNNHYHLENDGTITYDQSMKNIFNGLIDNYINDTGYSYVYSSNINQHYSSFPDGTSFNATKDFIDSHINEVCIYYLPYSMGTHTIFTFPYDGNFGLIRTDLSVNDNQVAGKPVDFDLWEFVKANKYQYNSSTNEYELIEENVNYQDENAYYKIDRDLRMENRFNDIVITNSQTKEFVMFNTLNDLKAFSIGSLPYYFNNSVYNNWISSTGDYIVTTDNSNKATYGDITNYVNSFNTENGTNPSPNDINIFIENYDPTVNPTPTPNPDNPSGNGSFVNNNSPVFNNNPNININLLPGDGTVSGNGTGGSSGIGNIFGFLSDIGKFLGDLIKNLGQALVDVIKGIGDLFNSIITELPTVFFDFLGAVFNWLPEDWVRLMGLSFACMLIVGVIKIFRR